MDPLTSPDPSNVTVHYTLKGIRGSFTFGPTSLSKAFAFLAVNKKLVATSWFHGIHRVPSTSQRKETAP